MRPSGYVRRYKPTAGYTGVLVANPVNADYEAAWLRVAAYPLAELTAWIPRGWRRPVQPTTDAGRNCYLFHEVLSWVSRPAQWYADLHAITEHARTLNAKFPFGLPDAEVRIIARSVARIHAEHMASGQEERFRGIQAARGRKNTREHLRAAGQLGGRPRLHTPNADGLMPWEIEGVSRRTWYYRRVAQNQPKQDSPAQPALIVIHKERLKEDPMRDSVLARVVNEITDALEDHPLAVPATLSVYLEGLGPDRWDDDPEDVDVTGEMLAEIWDHEGSRVEWLKLARERLNEWAAEMTVEEMDCATGVVTTRPMEGVAA